jgi:hypothetical protein
MSEQVALGPTALAIVALHVWGSLWLARGLSTWLTDRTGPGDEASVIDADTGIAIDPDDVILNREEVDDGTGHRTWRSVSRWEKRYRYWWVFVALRQIDFSAPGGGRPDGGGPSGPPPPPPRRRLRGRSRRRGSR